MIAFTVVVKTRRVYLSEPDPNATLCMHALC